MLCCGGCAGARLGTRRIEQAAQTQALALQLLQLAIALLFIKLSLGYVEQSYAINETSADPGGIPYRWAVKALIPLGYGLLVLQQLAHLVRLLQQKHPATGTTAVTPAVTTAKEDGHV